MDPTTAIDPGMPTGLKFLMYLVFGLYAIKQGYDVWAAREIKKELSTNGGESVKDKVNQAAKDSKKAAEDSQTALGLFAAMSQTLRATNRRIRTSIKELGQLKGQVNHIQEQQLDLEHRFARYVVHEARQDLGTSSLAKEEAKRLGQELEGKPCDPPSNSV